MLTEEVIRFDCDCGARLNAPSHLRGKVLPCPNCKKKLLVPSGVVMPKPVSVSSGNETISSKLQKELKAARVIFQVVTLLSLAYFGLGLLLGQFQIIPLLVALIAYAARIYLTSQIK